MIRRRLFADDEDRFSGASEAQLLPGEALDRGGVAAQGGDLRGEPRVLRLELLDLPCERTGPLPLAHELEQPVVAEKRADHQTDHDDDRGEDRRLLSQAYFRASTLVLQNFNLYLNLYA
jgi:hypothetical protein